jgi:hypothetical protein
MACMTPFIKALQRIQSLTAEWPGDDVAAARILGTVNAIAYGALLAVTEGTKPNQEATTVKTQFDMELDLDLSKLGGIFASDVAAIASIEYEVEHYRRGDYVVCSWKLVDIRYPGVPGADKSKEWLWEISKAAVDNETTYVDAAIRNHIEDSRDFSPAANLHLMSAVS